MKQKVLFFLKLPPPLTGATLMNKIVSENKLLNENFIIKTIPITYKNTIENITFFSFKKIKTIILLYIKLIRAIILFHPKFIYFQISPIGIAFLRDCTFVFLMKLFRVHIIYHLHGKGIHASVSRSRLKKSIYQWVFKNSSVICLANNLMQDIKGIYDGKPYVVNNAIEINDYRPRSKENKKQITILFFSNLIITKGIFDFMDAIVNLNSINKTNSYIAIIAGNEVELSSQNLQIELRRRNLEKTVKYIGPRYNTEKIELFENSDILVYPSYNDAFPLVLLEAMQAGIPIIASCEGAIPEIVDDGITGFIVQKHNPDEIADKLELLINDTDLRIKMGIEGNKKFLNKYTLQQFEQNIDNVFHCVIQNIL